METLYLVAVHLGNPYVFLAAAAGVTWGILGGAMPGISPSITMALLLPFTYTMDPTGAIVLLASTYVGAEYGGSIPAILIRTPGTNAAAATVIDGYEMNKQGRAGLALGISLYSGVLGSLFGLTMLILLSKPLASVALAFTPPAYFALGVLGLSVIATLSGDSLLKGFVAALLGLMIATIGTDPVTGANRFTFGSSDLLSGIAPVLIMVGMFAMSELLVQASDRSEGTKVLSRPRIEFPGLKLARRLMFPQSIGATIGTFEGVMPGAGGTIASFMSYNEARRWSRHKEEFGKGSPEGIAAPETANNAVAETALVPLLSFGIPGSNSTAILLGGFLIHGLVPGPMLFTRSADVVHGLYAGLFIAAIGLLVIGILMLPMCIWLVNRPRPYLSAFIFALILSGIFSIHASLFDLAIMLAAGTVGFFMRMLRIPFLPAVLGLVLGYLVESSFRRSLVLSGDDLSIFFTDKVSLALLVVAFLFVAGSVGKRALDFVRHRPSAHYSEGSE
ncbi:tripartite tricarboxylate transporter permease [Hoeflea sp. YIM 152468]|uniref:tripartite tricarboxylate transporter permease n=1 Tax=Hoeflea sp. YIM 152468 TaxID=3031759 RepID=UPI0023DC8C59|nr:tripartite tricarboxylate transporter permease [Hoeflea sp. YIM 152468]MDF1608702.1 tripartite tricarboxylate transporter permease [Hoeflea sp. YIM 152468]